MLRCQDLANHSTRPRSAAAAALQSLRHRRQPGGCPSGSVIRSATVASVTGWPKLGTHLQEVCAMNKILVTLPALAMSAVFAFVGAPLGR